MDTKLSIITVALNNLSGLKKTSASLETQTYRDFEWIVVDGASNDGTGEWLAGTNAAWISEPDSGLYDAMNKGLERAKGDYLLFLNAGDTLAAPEVLEKLLREIKSTDHPNFIYGDAFEERTDAPPFLKPARPHTTIARDMITHHQAMLYRREMLAGLRYNLAYRLAADYDFTARFLLQGVRAHHAPFPICVFEAGGLSQRHAATARAEEFRIRRTLKLCGLPRALLIYIRQSITFTVRRRLPWLYRIMR